jgi:hypothetical protein
MAAIDEEMLRAAMAPGVAQAKKTFGEVGEEMGARSADEVHDELVKRLQADPFAWDDGELRKIAATIGQPSSDEPAKDEPDTNAKDEPPTETKDED